MARPPRQMMTGGHMLCPPHDAAADKKVRGGRAGSGFADEQVRNRLVLARKKRVRKTARVTPDVHDAVFQAARRITLTPRPGCLRLCLCAEVTVHAAIKRIPTRLRITMLRIRHRFRDRARASSR